MRPGLLIIGGMDPSGHAGVLRDTEVGRLMGFKPHVVLAATTIQTKKRFIAAQTCSPRFFKKQLQAVLPLAQYRAVKIGMLGDAHVVRALADFFRKNKKKLPPVVLDPVYRSTSGGELLSGRGREVLYHKLLPLASLWTPNVGEFSFYADVKIRSRQQLFKTAKEVWGKTHTPIFIKGFLEGNWSHDLLVARGEATWFKSKRHAVHAIRGSGCALATFIACRLASQKNLGNAVRKGRLDFNRWQALALAAHN